MSGPRRPGPPDDPAKTDDAPPDEAGHHGAIETLADVTVRPVQAGLKGSALWLRWALLSHLAGTLSATLVAHQGGLPDWELYAWMGLCTVILVGNFARWRTGAGWIRRSLGTLAAVGVALTWTGLLVDRAAGAWEASTGLAVASPGLFWLPVLLYVLSAVLLVGNLFDAPRRVAA